MKKSLKAIISLMLALLLCVSYFGVSAFAAESQGGYIVLPENADIKLTTAADTLAKYLNQITDKAYPVSNSGEGIKFVIDYTKDIADNGYIINTSETEVTIKGSGVRGVIHGVYAFLEKYCNCDWYTEKFISVPKNENLTFTKDETKYEPYFEFADTDWNARSVEYSLANGLTGGAYRDISLEYGGAVEYLTYFQHTLAGEFLNPDEYFEEHPEYYALVGGERKPVQPCLTNEDVYKIVRDKVFDILKEKHNPEESLQIISITQFDTTEYCTCENCKAIDDANGAHSGTMITFVNRIAREIKAAGYDNVALDTFAYKYTRQAPTEVVPEDNVIVRFCTIEGCFAHALDDTSCEQNVPLMEDLKNWGEICNRVYIWDYTTNYTHTVGIFPNFGVLQMNVQIFAENNVKGVYEEGNHFVKDCDTEFGDLRAYLLSKLMQNPYMDYEAAMVEFNNAFYGEAGKHITEFIKMTMEKPVFKGEYLALGSCMGDILNFTAKDIKAADKLWKDAKAAVADDETLLKRVERSELSWRYWKMYRTLTPSTEEIDALIADLKAFNVQSIRENGASVDTIKEEFFDVYFNENGYLYNTFLVSDFVLYAICLLLALIIAVFALKLKPKKWQYPVLFVVSLGFAEVFNLNRSTFIKWDNISLWGITLGLIALLFGTLGAFSVRGKKKQIISGIVSAVLALVLYELCVIFINGKLFDNSLNELTSYIMFALLGFLGIVIEAVSLKNIIKAENKRICYE